MTSTPTILLGSQRSGTTALAHMLSEAFNEHGGIFTVNGKLPYYLYRWLQEGDLRYRHFRVDEILYSLKRKEPNGLGVETWLENVEKILREVATDVANGKYEDPIMLARYIIERSYGNYPFWGDKYNEYLLNLPYLQQVIPNARFIVLFRNPYEVAASVENWTGDRPWRPTNLESHLNKWSSWHNEIRSMLSVLPEHRYIVIEYDRLCSGDETELISNFLNLDVSSKLKNLKRLSTKKSVQFSDKVNEVWDSMMSFKLK